MGALSFLQIYPSDFGFPFFFWSEEIEICFVLFLPDYQIITRKCKKNSEEKLEKGGVREGEDWGKKAPNVNFFS